MKSITILKDSNIKYSLEFNKEEAIVFLDWLSRFNEDQHDFQDQSEERILWDLEAALESAIPESLHEDYAGILEEARNIVRDYTPDSRGIPKL